MQVRCTEAHAGLYCGFHVQGMLLQYTPLRFHWRSACVRLVFGPTWQPSSPLRLVTKMSSIMWVALMTGFSDAQTQDQSQDWCVQSSCTESVDVSSRQLHGTCAAVSPSWLVYMHANVHHEPVAFVHLHRLCRRRGVDMRTPADATVQLTVTRSGSSGFSAFSPIQ